MTKQNKDLHRQLNGSCGTESIKTGLSAKKSKNLGKVLFSQRWEIVVWTSIRLNIHGNDRADTLFRRGFILRRSQMRGCLHAAGMALLDQN
jgi:hypothetical protein